MIRVSYRYKHFDFERSKQWKIMAMSYQKNPDAAI